MGFEITTTRGFSASHQLRLLDGSMEDLHGHNWVVRVTVAGGLDAMGTVMDFHDLEKRVDEFVAPMHNRHLNHLADFATVNPTAENVAGHIGKRIRLPNGVELRQVEVWETPQNSAIYRP